MVVRGVGVSGKDIKVNNDFVIHIPYGCCYEVEDSSKEGDKVLSIMRPETTPTRYKDGSFSISDETDFDVSLGFSLSGTVELKKGETEIDYPIEEKLKKLSKEAKNVSLDIGISVGDSSRTIRPGGGEDNFHRMYKVVKDAPYIKAGYSTMGIVGKTVYNIVVITPKHIYICGAGRFADENYKRNEKFLDSLISSIEAINPPVAKEVSDKNLKKEEAKAGKKNDVKVEKKPEKKAEKTPEPKKESGGSKETYIDFIVTDNVSSLKKYISAFNRTWEKDLRSSNDAILNERPTPITRVNDSRIRKIGENSAAVIHKHAEKLQEVIDKLDEIGDSLRKNGGSDEELTTICKLIEDGVEKLHISTKVEIFKEKKEFKHSVDSRYSNLSRKWKRIYNNLPSTQILALKKEIEEKENSMEPLKKQISSAKRKRTTLSGKISELEQDINTKTDSLTKTREEADRIISECENKQNVYQSEISELREACVTLDESVSSLQMKINGIRSDADKKIEPYEKEKKDVKKSLDDLVYDKETLETEERIKKTKADKAFLFKKKKQSEYEEIHQRVEEKNEGIKQCKERIDSIDAEIALIREESNRTILKVTSELDEKKSQAQKKRGRIDSLEREIKTEQSRISTQKGKITEVEKTLRDVEKTLKDKQKELNSLEKQITTDEKTRDSQLDEIEQINGKIAELEQEKEQKAQKAAEQAIKHEKSSNTTPKEVRIQENHSEETGKKKEKNNKEGTPMSENTIVGARFFIHDEINQALFNFDGEDGSIGIPFVTGDSFCADIIEQPFHYKVVTDDECVKMEIYIRREIGIFEGDPNVTYTVFKDDREPEVGGSGGIGGDPGQIGGLFLKAACALRGLLEEKGLISEFTGMDPDAEGILVSHDNGDLNFKKVEGKKRPAMACTTLFGGVQMKRPYMDEISDAWAMDMMSFDERVELAEDGDIDSMKRLANSYLDGDSDVDEDPEKAAYWMEKAAEAGDSESQFNMGLFYAKGHGVKRDFAKMAEWMGKASENGEEDAEGFLKEFGNMADDLIKAENGDAQAQAEVAAGLMKLGPIMDQAGSEGDYEESVKWATKAAEQNNGFGLWTLALAYEHGRGVTINPKKAIELYQKGADINDPRCLHNLGCQYLSGENIKKDAHKGFAMIKQAAEQGYGLAMRDLGRCYQFATGTPGNMKTAIEWYEKALEVIDDPELERKTALFKTLADSDPKFSEDYPEDEDYGDVDSKVEDATEIIREGLMELGEDFDDDSIANLSVDEAYEALAAAQNKSAKPKKELTEADKKKMKAFFNGKNFVLSGFDSFTEPPIREVIEENGGVVRSSTVLDTDYLIYHEKFGVGTKKHERALELNRSKGKNIRIIPLKEFNRMVSECDFS